MSDNQLPDYPWEHPQESDYEEARAMSDNATLVERLRSYNTPGIKMEAAARIAELEDQLPEGMKHCTILFKECEKGHGRLTATNWIDRGCPWCRIAELEAERDKLTIENVDLAISTGKRRAELEAEVARLTDYFAQDIQAAREEEREANAIQCERIADYAIDITNSIRARSNPK